MDFEFNAEQESLRATTRRFLAAQAPITPYVRTQLADERGTTDAVWQGLAELGAIGLLVPEAHGGAGLGMVDMGVVLEEMGRMAHPGPFVSSAVGAVSAIAVMGTAEQHARLLPGLADGTTVATVALFEAARPGEWQQIGTTAGRTAGRTAGADWSLSGEKVWVPDAAAANVLLVSALTEDGMRLFAVDRLAPGVDVTPVATVDGTRKLATVTLNRAPGLLLGEDGGDGPGDAGGGDAGGGDAGAGLSEVVDRVTTALVVDGVGAAEVALELAVEYAKQRVQFDKPIGSFQAVQHLCAEMLQSLELGRAGAYYALWALDRADPMERHRAATMAKAYAGDAFFRIGAGAIQVFGGVGFTWEHDVHLFYKRLMTLQDSWGGTSRHLEELATIIL